MFKQVFRITFITFVWKQYKRWITSTFALFLFFWFVGYAHNEYLQFATQQTPSLATGKSFFIKWLCLIIGIVCYFAFHTWHQKKGKKTQPNHTHQTSKKKSDAQNQNDPFDVIRKKTKLRTRADILIEKKK